MKQANVVSSPFADLHALLTSFRFQKMGQFRRFTATERIPSAMLSPVTREIPVVPVKKMKDGMALTARVGKWCK